MDEATIVTQFTSSAAIVWAIQELKRAGWCRFIDTNTIKLNRLISALAALASGAAINWTWDATTSTVTISGLTLAAVGTFLWQAAQQFIGQEVIYQAVYAPKAARDAVQVPVGTGDGQAVRTAEVPKSAVHGTVNETFKDKP